MHGIECIEAVLQELVGYALSSAVKPYGNKRKHCKALSGYLEHLAEKFKGNNLTFEEDDVDANHTDKLTNPCKGEVSENVEHYHHKHTVETVVNEAYN